MILAKFTYLYAYNCHDIYMIVTYVYLHFYSGYTDIT